MSSDLMGLIWLVVLLIGNAFFVGGEFAVMGARRSQIEPRAEAGHKRAKTALYAMEHVSQMLAICQLGITVCSLLILNISEPAIHHLFVVPLEAIGVPAAAADITAFVLALLIVTFLHVTFGEMVPKNAAVSMADKAVMLLAPPLVWLDKVLRPVIWFMNWMANIALKAMRVEPKDEVNSSFTLEEVQSIVTESTRTGLVDDSSGLLAGALEFTAHTAGSVMVPDADVITLPAGGTPADFEEAVRKTGFSRFVLENDDASYLGYLHLKDIMTIPAERSRESIPLTKVRSMANVDASEEIEDALSLMQRTGSHMARVISADGQTVGVLFLEDVLEILVGEIHDATQANAPRSRY
ncbi:MAG: hemolysin family protein [Micrococcaceae bacterium]